MAQVQVLQKPMQQVIGQFARSQRRMQVNDFLQVGQPVNREIGDMVNGRRQSLVG